MHARSLPSSFAELQRAARVKAGHTKFRANQFLASNAVPLYRRVRSIDTPLAERYLFVLAHPRSGSTVLSHVLQSHADILGFGEHHEGYTTDEDLEALAARNAFFERAPRATQPYTLDKIVWNHHDIDDHLLTRPDTRFVFLAREPVATLESYRRMFHDMPTDERRLQSYRTRLEGLTDLARRIGDPGRAMFITYGDLTERTDDTLRRLTEWLELDAPLTPQYDLNAKSGSQSWGDPSEHIKAGSIITVPHEPTQTDPSVLSEAHDVYQRACADLASLTTTQQPPVPGSR